VLSGRVAYIDPKLNEETRTARVRIEMSNPGERLKAGMFVQVGFQTGSAESSDQELVVKAEALQRLGERTVVFLPQDDEPGAFEIRDVQVGAETNGYTRILGGLQLGEKVVTKGSFTLKTQLMKGELGDHDHR
jgi:multidrug efflux pump subunit AcrA (membrane-fusion protein)